jgi:hypothetical protein
MRGRLSRVPSSARQLTPRRGARRLTPMVMSLQCRLPGERTDVWMVRYYGQRPSLFWGLRQLPRREAAAIAAGARAVLFLGGHLRGRYAGAVAEARERYPFVPAAKAVQARPSQDNVAQSPAPCELWFMPRNCSALHPTRPAHHHHLMILVAALGCFSSLLPPCSGTALASALRGRALRAMHSNTFHLPVSMARLCSCAATEHAKC